MRLEEQEVTVSQVAVERMNLGDAVVATIKNKCNFDVFFLLQTIFG